MNKLNDWYNIKINPINLIINNINGKKANTVNQLNISNI